MPEIKQSLKEKLNKAKWDAITKRDGTLPPVDREENALRARQARIAEQGV